MSSSFTYTWYLPCVTTTVFDILDILVDICKHFLTLYYRIFLLTHPITNTSAPILESIYAKSQIHEKRRWAMRYKKSWWSHTHWWSIAPFWWYDRQSFGLEDQKCHKTCEGAFMYCQLSRIMLLQLITYVVQLLNWMPLTLLLSLPCFEPLLEPHFSSSVVESNSNFLQWSPPCEYSPLQYLSDAVASSNKEDWNTRVASCQRMKEKRNVLGCLLPA